MKKTLMLLATMMFVFASCGTDDPVTPEQPSKPGSEEPEPEPEKPDKPVGAIDLNSNNPETANCYIVSKEGRYCFTANVIGNGDTGLVSGLEPSVATITPTKAILLWSETDKLISDVEYKDGKIYFTCSRFDGNAVIAATDDAGKILWSWHIWSTVAPETFKLQYSDGKTTWEVMDRNLGAYSKNVEDMEDSYGMFYQWGRKDPFSMLRLDQSLPDGKFHPRKGTDTGDNQENKLSYSIEHPDTWLVGNQYAGDADQRSWLYSADAEGQKQFNMLWGNNCFYSDESKLCPQKTIFDPCPAGYRVAVHKFYMFAKDNSGVWAQDSKTGALTICNNVIIPKAGFIDYNGEHNGSDVTVWTDSSAWGGNDKSFRILPGDSNDQTGRGRAMPVRCMKIVK